ncbi:MAG: hypothetical protein QMD03_05760 [Syntrophales bacterium]|nr:hypothetical protein [Syntrophales bacterium]
MVVELDKLLLFDGGSIRRTALCANEIMTQNVGCGTDDRGRDVSGRLFFRVGSSYFGHFTRDEGLFRHNPGRPVLYAHYA